VQFLNEPGQRGREQHGVLVEGQVGVVVG